MNSLLSFLRQASFPGGSSFGSNTGTVWGVFPAPTEKFIRQRGNIDAYEVSMGERGEKGCKPFIAVEDFGGEPALVLGSRENGGRIRHLFLKRVGRPTLLRDQNRGIVIPRADVVGEGMSLMLGYADQTPTLVVVKTGASRFTKTSVPHGVRVISNATVVCDGEVKSKYGLVVSREYLVSFKGPGAIGIVFVDGGVKVLKFDGRHFALDDNESFKAKLIAEEKARIEELMVLEAESEKRTEEERAVNAERLKRSRFEYQSDGIIGEFRNSRFMKDEIDSFMESCPYVDLKQDVARELFKNGIRRLEIEPPVNQEWSRFTMYLMHLLSDNSRVLPWEDFESFRKEIELLKVPEFIWKKFLTHHRQETPPNRERAAREAHKAHLRQIRLNNQPARGSSSGGGNGKHNNKQKKGKK